MGGVGGLSLKPGSPTTPPADPFLQAVACVECETAVEKRSGPDAAWARADAVGRGAGGRGGPEAVENVRETRDLVAAHVQHAEAGEFSAIHPSQS